jgi:hypothetical protein
MQEIVHVIVENLLIPAIILIAGTVMVLLQRATDKVVKYLQLKGAIANVQAETEIRKKITDTIAIHVKAAVANTMDIALKMKENGKLSEEQIKELNDHVHALVMNSLPPSLLQEGNVILETIGGKEVLMSIVDNLMEQYVYEYKHGISTEKKTSEEK